MNLGLEGRVCVVTGGSRGIGAATVRMLAQEGARVLSVARSGADVELDVTVPDAGERLLAACPEPPWALVNNAGVRPGDDRGRRRPHRERELVVRPASLGAARRVLLGDEGGAAVAEPRLRR